MSQRKRFKLKKNISLPVLGTSFAYLVTQASAQCFQNTRLPKVLQTTNNESDNSAEAIATHDSIDAVFVGGNIT